MRDFSKVADYLIPRRKRVHISVFIFTILMIPGILATFEPIDIESYEMESPELDANMVFREEFTAQEISGDLEYSSEMRQISAVLSPMFL